MYIKRDNLLLKKIKLDFTKNTKYFILFILSRLYLHVTNDVLN